MRTQVDALPLGIGLGKFLLSVRQRLLLGLAVYGAEPLADLSQLVGYSNGPTVPQSVHQNGKGRR